MKPNEPERRAPSRHIPRRGVLRSGAALLATAAGLPLVAACGADDTTPIRSGPVNLSLWTHDEGYVKFFTAAVPLAEENSDFTYNVTITRTGSNHLITKLIAQAVADTGTPDVAGLEVEGFTRMLRGDIAPELLVDLTDDVQPFADDLIAARIAPFSKDGALYALDSDTPVTLLYYREDEFQKYGISLDDMRTWDDFAEVGTRLAQEQNVALGALTVNDPIGTVQGFSQQLLQRGGTLFTEDGAPNVDTPEAEDTLTLIVDGVQNGFIATVADMYGPSIQSGLKGSKIIAVNMPTWYESYGLQPNVPEQSGQWRIAPLPLFSQGGHKAGMAGGTEFAALKDKPATPAARNLVLSTYLDAEQQVKRYKDMGYLPTLRSVYDNAELLALEDDYLGGQKPFEVFRSVIDDVPEFYQSPDNAIMQTVLSGHILRALKGTVSPARAMSDATEDFLGQAKG